MCFKNRERLKLRSLKQLISEKLIKGQIIEEKHKIKPQTQKKEVKAYRNEITITINN